MFGRHGRVSRHGEEEDRPVKNFKWLYRIGGLVMLIITLKFAGVI